MRWVDDILADNSDSVFHLGPSASGKSLLTGLPFAFLPTRPQSFGATPRLGEHADEALSGWLDMTASEMADLHAKEILV